MEGFVQATNPNVRSNNSCQEVLGCSHTSRSMVAVKGTPMLQLGAHCAHTVPGGLDVIEWEPCQDPVLSDGRPSLGPGHSQTPAKHRATGEVGRYQSLLGDAIWGRAKSNDAHRETLDAFRGRVTASLTL